MLARKRKAKGRGTDSAPPEDQETVKEIQETEHHLREMLNPMESKIMTIQSVLVWEDPKYTAATLVVVNILFWLATTMRIYRLIGLTGLVVVFLDMWTKKIWPEIRVPPPPNEDTEGWTPVHPQLLSVPEVSQYIATYWVYTTRRVRWVWKLRQESHFKFFLVMTFFFGVLWVIGHYTTGWQLCFFTVNGLLLFPAVIYNQLPQKLYQMIEPHIFNLEKTFNVKRKKTRKSKRKSGEEGSRAAAGTDSDSDAEIREFCPEPTTHTAKRALSRAAKCGDDSTTSSASSLLRPDSASQGPSREHSDDGSHTDEDISFAQGLHSIPGIDDSALDADDEDHDIPSRLEVPDIDTSESEQDTTFTAEYGPGTTASDMKFVEKHFKESSESDIDDESKLAAGLSMPDMEEVDGHDQSKNTLLGQMTQQMTAAMATEVMSQTMTSFMSSTMSGLSKLGETMLTVAQQSSAPGGEASYQAGNVSVQPPQSGLAESSDSADILASFEFLEQEDIDNTDPDSNVGQDNKKQDD